MIGTVDTCQICGAILTVTPHLYADCTGKAPSGVTGPVSQPKPKDDGKRTEYDSGALRSDRTGRGRYDLVSPHGLKRLAIQYEHGAKQKGERNWEQGFPISRALCSLIGHAYDYLQGDRSEDHLAAAAWQVFAAMHFEELTENGELPPELNDVKADVDSVEGQLEEDKNAT